MSQPKSMTRLFISPNKRVTIPWLLEILNTILQDPELGRPVIGSIKRTKHTNIWGSHLFVAEVIRGSDSLDELLEHIQNSYLWVVSLSAEIKAEIWEVFDGMGDYLKYYEDEREIHRKKLMRKWAWREPTDAGRSLISWSKEEEVEYQARLRLMKITSEMTGIFEPTVPDHFTDHTIEFLDNLAIKSIPSSDFYKKLAEAQEEEACGWAATWNDVTVAPEISYPWTLSNQELAFYRESLKKNIDKAAANFLE